MKDLIKMSEARQWRVKKFIKNVKDVPKKLEREKLKNEEKTEEIVVNAVELYAPGGTHKGLQIVSTLL